MTNGEKIQQDFKCEVYEPIIEDNIIHVCFSGDPLSAIGFDWDWWNAEYKEPTTKNDSSELEKNSKKLEEDSEWQKDHAILKAYSDGANEVLDKIRAEIEKLQKMCDENDLNLMAQYSAFGMVLDILDKYKAETVVEDGNDTT